MLDAKLQSLLDTLTEYAKRNGTIDTSALVDLNGYVEKATQEEFVESSGTLCPFCGAGILVYSRNFRLDVNVVIHGVECDCCHKAWDETYSLSGYRPNGETIV